MAAGPSSDPPAETAPRSTVAEALSPLRQPLYRAMWLATFGSNIGTFIQQAGASVMVAELSPSPLVVAAIQAAGSLPGLMLALPAGALADVVDRRRLILGAQLWMFVVSLVMTVLAAMQWLNQQGLLLLVLLSAAGTALAGPASRAILGEVLPHEEIPRAVTLEAAGLNLARAAGPLIAGVLLAWVGPWSAFALNTLTFIGLITVLVSWRRAKRACDLPAERVLGAVVVGLRYLRHSPPLRSAVVRTGIFAVGASALWALLPLVALRELQIGSIGYGALMGCLGVGSLAAVSQLPVLRQRLSPNGLVGFTTLAFALATLGLAHVRWMPLLVAALMVGGFAWVCTFSTLASTAGGTAAPWVMGRGLAAFGFVFQGGLTLGSLAWGWVALQWGVPAALTGASALLGAGLLAAHRWPLVSPALLNLNPSGAWQDPITAQDPEQERGPVLITVEYRIDPARAGDFARAMQSVREQRLRDGGFAWGLYEDAADPGRVVECFYAASWLEHLRQHQRVTHADEEATHAVHAFHLGPQPPLVSHLLGSIGGTRRR